MQRRHGRCACPARRSLDRVLPPLNPTVKVPSVGAAVRRRLLNSLVGLVGRPALLLADLDLDQVPGLADEKSPFSSPERCSHHPGNHEGA
jgi:hypothetical protein